mgnify:FL=1
MIRLLTAPLNFLSQLQRLDPLLPLFARATFAATLLVYFWSSAFTKIGPNPWTPSSGAFAQIFPRALEAVSYDASRLSPIHHFIVLSGTYAEFILPALLVLGLLTRLMALGMMGFITLQSLTDLFGHGGIAHAETLGRWFDRFPDGAILDQRAFWMLTLSILLVKGAGPVSLDAWWLNRRQ